MQDETVGGIQSHTPEIKCPNCGASHIDLIAGEFGSFTCRNCGKLIIPPAYPF
jgi:ssDNA-binding Zn-finger/Zn-ribbon topoisomerase 1